MPNVDQFFSACVYARERVNPHLFVYAASVAILHRNDTRHIALPPNCEVLPELYVEGGVFARAREEVGIVPSGSRVRPRSFHSFPTSTEYAYAYPAPTYSYVTVPVTPYCCLAYLSYRYI